MLHITIDYVGDNEELKNVYENIIKGLLNYGNKGFLVERFDEFSDKVTYKKNFKISKVNEGEL